VEKEIPRAGSQDRHGAVEGQEGGITRQGRGKEGAKKTGKKSVK
jgi:hypothetical protein